MVPPSPIFGSDDSYVVFGGQIHCTEEGARVLMKAANIEYGAYGDMAGTTGYPIVSNGNGWMT